ncbi:MAG TPA: hypothetical protein VGB76_16475 [Pyrinomonadaceae bacterium]|jgi:hypothetical protein
MGGVNFKPGVHGTGQHPAGGAQGDGDGVHGNSGKTNPHDEHGRESQGQSRRNGRVAARVGELAAQTQHVADKIKRGNGHQPKSDSTTHPDSNSRSNRSHGNHRNGDQHGRVERGNQTHAHDSHGRDVHGRDVHGRGHDSSLTPAAVKYLRGESGNGALPVNVRGALDTLKTALGQKPLEELLSERGHKVEKLIDHFLRQSERASERVGEHGRRTVHQAADELFSAVQLEKHFARLERTGGDAARRAEEAVFRLLFNAHGELHNDHQRAQQRDRQVTELWRDLRSGAFLPAQDSYSQFQLTGRARVVNEMIELLHTLDALERGASQQFPGGAKGAGQQGALAETLAGRLANLTEAELAELLNLLPTLPGRAGRNEMVRLLAALSGPLMDADGKMLLAKDGTPLKPDQLLWLSTVGGLPGSGFKGELYGTHLSPLIVFGFDALYSLIGFDGRTLVPPHFAAVQAQINNSELEWVCGQPPLTEGWMHALIERLKDSAEADQNLLGEMLEEALVDGRFHAVLVQGSVAEGEAVSGSFSVTRLLPDPSAAQSFATS